MQGDSGINARRGVVQTQGGKWYKRKEESGKKHKEGSVTSSRRKWYKLKEEVVQTQGG